MSKVLILGGSNFIGRNLVNTLLESKTHDITLFNRGITNPKIFPEIRQIHGDRNTEAITKISNEEWDYIIDLSCYHPDTLDKTLVNLSKKPKRYIFISSCSTYNVSTKNSNFHKENTALQSCNNVEKKDNSPETYGKRKAECERLLKRSEFNYTIFRPALVYGQYDNTDRLYYWLYNIKKENQLLLPNEGKNVFAVTYVKDIVNAIIKSIHMDDELSPCIYNVITYPNFSIAQIIDLVSKLVNTKPLLVNVNSEFLKSNNIKEWTDIPLWIDNDYFTFNNMKLLNDLKLELTDINSSLKNTINYYDRLNWKTPKYGISEKQKQKLINKSQF